jgi:LuxR family maltose regulon positive regulatory protein
VGCPVLGLSLHWHGQPADAFRTLSEAAQIASANGNHLAAMHASGGLAAISYERGELDSARSRAEQALALAAEHELSEHWASSLALAVRGQLLAEADDVESADRVVEHALALARRGIASIEIAYALLALAAVQLRLGRDQDARMAYEAGREAVAQCEDPGILRERLMRLERSGRLSRSARRGHVAGPSDALSQAELSVLRLLRSELTQREIAAELQLSFNTIKTHTRNIYRKLDVTGRVEAIARARELGVI